MKMYLEQAAVIIKVLVKIHNEAKLYDNNSNDYVRCAFGIKKILDNVKDFDVETMVDIIKITIDKLGETLKPLDSSILKEMIKAGFVVTQVSNITSYRDK